MFITAQKHGSLTVASPQSNYSSKKDILQVPKISEVKKKTGKKLFPSNLSNTYSIYAPFQFEAPPRANYKIDEGLSKTIDYKQDLGSQPMNGKFTSTLIILKLETFVSLV